MAKKAGCNKFTVKTLKNKISHSSYNGVNYYRRIRKQIKNSCHSKKIKKQLIEKLSEESGFIE